MENKLQTYQKNEVIFREGVVEKCMYDIGKGSVNIYANYGAENEKLLSTLVAGQYFGEIGIADRVPRTATAVAAEDGTELAVITDENFLSYFYNNSDKVLAIMRNISARLRTLTKDYMDVCQALAEAAESARKKQKKSSGLQAKLSAIVKNYLKNAFVSAATNYDIDAFMAGEKSQIDVKTFHRGQVIIREGDASNCMYDIMLGCVAVYVNYGTPAQKKLIELGADEFFGEMGLLEQESRSATVVALEDDTKVGVIFAQNFADYMQKKPAKVMMMMSQLSSRLRNLTKKYMEACRAVAEAMEQDDNDSGSGWMKENVMRFINEYNEAMRMSNENQSQYGYFGNQMFY